MYRIYFNLLVILLVTLVSDTVTAAPVITSISPSAGPSSGNTTVTILGSGFTGTTAVYFALTPATSFNVLSDSQLTAVSPAETPQVVSLTVVSGDQSSTYYVYQGNWQVYVANGSGSSVSVIDPVNDVVVGSSIPVGNNPCYITFSPDGAHAFVSNQTDNTLTVIDSTINAVVGSPFLSGGTFPNPIVTSLNGGALYVANDNSGVIAALNASTGGSIWTYSTGGNPSTLALTPDGNLLGVTDTATNQVIFLNTQTGSLDHASTVGVSQDCIVLNPGTATAYVTNNTSQSVSILNPYTGTSSIPIAVGNNPTALAVTPDGSKVYVVNEGDNNVSVIATDSNTVVDSISLGVSPKNIMITPDGSKGYVTNNTSGTVSVINTEAESVSTISTGIEGNPYAIGILPDGSKVFVANAGSDSVSIIDTSDDTVVATLSVGLLPCSIAVTPDQAPLASFTYQIDSSGQVATFDASASASPVGTIANYSWNFGDGSSLETSQPTTSHVYANGGTYSVTLTVTNSAGTSTQQIFNHSSSRINQMSLAVSQSEMITHNGGPTATTTQSLTLSLGTLAPTNLRGRQKAQKFLTQTDLINIVTWQQPQGGLTPYLYRIYRNSSLTDLAGVVPANGPLEFLDHNRRRGVVYWYYIVTVSQSGNVSNPASISVTSR